MSFETVVFFLLGAIAGVVRSDLKIPGSIFNALSIFLLLVIGLIYWLHSRCGWYPATGCAVLRSVQGCACPVSFGNGAGRSVLWATPLLMPAVVTRLHDTYETNYSLLMYTRLSNSRADLNFNFQEKS